MSSLNSYIEALVVNRMALGDGIVGEENAKRAESQDGISGCIERRRECSFFPCNETAIHLEKRSDL